MGAKTVLAERCEATVRGIEETRRRISDKAGLLHDRLQPQAMLRPVTKRLQGTLGEGGEKILDAFRENPIPLTLAGLGLAWLLMKDMRSESGIGGDGGRPGRIQEKAEGAKEAVRKARSAVASVPRSVRKGFEKGSDWFTSTLEESPLALALGVLALGAIAGLSIPASAQEEETIGKAAEKAAEAVLDKGTEALAQTATPPGANPKLDMPASEEAPD